MGEGKRVQRKEITGKTTVKAVITGYIAYGILIGFIMLMLGLVTEWVVNQLSSVNQRVVSVTVSILGIFLMYFALHWVCKLGIYDVFKKCKTNPENIKKVLVRLNLFLLICVALSVIIVVLNLTVKFNNERREIQIASYQYNTIHSEEFARRLTGEMMNDYIKQRQNTIISTIILEMGLTLTLFSLIPYQKKLIEKYNEA